MSFYGFRLFTGLPILVTTVVSALVLGGCASIVKGTSQVVAINSTPQGANCILKRDGEGTIGTVAQTPGDVKLGKSSKNILITCNKPGFQPSTAVLNSELEVMTAGNLIFGGVIGLAVDAGTGALNKYDAAITVPLIPEGAGAPARQPASKPEKPIS